ncbi:MAG: hypothetical protein OXP71_10930 [Candidatus Poribacteria bacterium]|nr:hypothetical protein [Candidatus Poribacteria bacterium]
MENGRLPGETVLAYTYFEMYRDAGDERSLDALSGQEVTGKRRSVSMIKKWSVQYDWGDRVAAFDASVARRAADALLRRRASEIEAFIETDMKIASRVQALCLNQLQALETETDIGELRQLVLTYKEARLWMMELTGALEEDIQQ